MLLLEDSCTYKSTSLAASRYRLPIRWEERQAIVWNSKTFLRDMECLKWWKENQGLKGPFVHLDFDQQNNGTSYPALSLAGDATKFLVEYLGLSSAQYLDVDRFALYLFQQDFSESGSQAVCSQLQSLAISCRINDEGSDVPSWPRLGPFSIVPSLWRLRIHHVELSSDSYDMGNFINWSKLTHLSVSVTAQPGMWYSLIRGVPNLQWGHFHISLYSSVNDDPPNFVLPFLSTLSVGVNNTPTGELVLLKNLHCPALHDLSIDVSIYPSDTIFSAAIRINNVLKSTPAVTKLTLGLYFIDIPLNIGAITPTNWEEVEHLSALLPRLTHLLIDMCDVQPDFGHESMLLRMVAFWKDLLSPMRWVDIASPASKIHKITAVVTVPSMDSPLVEAALRVALKLGRGDDDEEADIVIFEVVQEDRRTISPYAQGWKTWDHSL